MWPGIKIFVSWTYFGEKFDCFSSAHVSCTWNKTMKDHNHSPISDIKEVQQCSTKKWLKWKPVVCVEKKSVANTSIPCCVQMLTFLSYVHAKTVFIQCIFKVNKGELVSVTPFKQFFLSVTPFFDEFHLRAKIHMLCWLHAAKMCVVFASWYNFLSWLFIFR